MALQIIYEEGNAPNTFGCFGVVTGVVTGAAQYHTPNPTDDRWLWSEVKQTYNFQSETVKHLHACCWLLAIFHTFHQSL